MTVRDKQTLRVGCLVSGSRLNCIPSLDSSYEMRRCLFRSRVQGGSLEFFFKNQLFSRNLQGTPLALRWFSLHHLSCPVGLAGNPFGPAPAGRSPPSPARPHLLALGPFLSSLSRWFPFIPELPFMLLSSYVKKMPAPSRSREPACSPD